ncbi:ubiquitin-like modifier-activating enzyme ATG7 [Epargyreus clarus]|uniref:ubiquitin-like modifier-activating enzyme ATG7 n=1 Tax=Epargyreus clarus TaxID=520877 RepID=UPI003C2EBA64
MDAETKGDIIQYVPFTSFVHPSFWHTFTEDKVDISRLNDASKEVYGRFSYRDDIKPVFEVDGTSFNSEPQEEPFYINVVGTIINKNTVESFKGLDKALFLNSVGDVVWHNIRRKTWIENPGVLLNFVILSFADLKKFNYYYWFTFPCPSQPTVYLEKKPKKAKGYFTKTELEKIIDGFKALPQKQKCFFLIIREESDITVDPLAKHIAKKDPSKVLDIEKTYFGFADPSNGENPGWPLRMLIAALLEHYEILPGKTIRALSLRMTPNWSIDNSLYYKIKVPEDVEYTESAGWIGWERNEKGNFGPRLANMSASMDPMKLAESSSDLNTRLMKWRLVPELDVEIIKSTKCLLLGAGTLGCHVARNLLAWGFRHITFVDSGTVSYSNPTRQVLYTYLDCLGGGRKKAEAAAENLKAILPTVKSHGIITHIPMPGHPVGDSMKDEILANIRTLSKAISEHDVVFLLLDSREARWMPTLIAAQQKKIVINAALGFDSYLVMRHGIGLVPLDEPGAVSRAYVPGGQLGCYFCNDVTAPGNSQKERTLDQQCTVSRPGAAGVAAALAVELLAALLQHPLKAEAPAICNLSEDSEKDAEITQGELGVVPHSIRGFLHSYQTVLPTCAKFKQCIACSDVVINAYKQRGTEFLLKVLDSASHLEEITGLTQLHLSAEMTDVLTFSDEDQDLE